MAPCRALRRNFVLGLTCNDIMAAKLHVMPWLAMVWQGVEQQSLALHGLAWQAGPRATGKVSERDAGLDWRVQKAPYSKAVGAL